MSKLAYPGGTMRLYARVANTIIFVCFIGPGPVIGFVPWLLSGWHLKAVHVPLRWLGASLILLGAMPLIAALFFHLSVMLYEEPRLQRKYGDSYAKYRQRVRRWIPSVRGVRDRAP